MDLSDFFEPIKLSYILDSHQSAWSLLQFPIFLQRSLTANISPIPETIQLLYLRSCRFFTLWLLNTTDSGRSSRFEASISLRPFLVYTLSAASWLNDAAIVSSQLCRYTYQWNSRLIRNWEADLFNIYSSIKVSVVSSWNIRIKHLEVIRARLPKRMPVSMPSMSADFPLQSITLTSSDPKSKSASVYQLWFRFFSRQHHRTQCLIESHLSLFSHENESWTIFWPHRISIQEKKLSVSLFRFVSYIFDILIRFRRDRFPLSIYSFEDGE